MGKKDKSKKSKKLVDGRAASPLVELETEVEETTEETVEADETTEADETPGLPEETETDPVNQLVTVLQKQHETIVSEIGRLFGIRVGEPVPPTTPPAAKGRVAKSLRDTIELLQHQAQLTGKVASAALPRQYSTKNYGEKLIAPFKGEFNVSTTDDFDRETGKFQVTLHVDANR